MKNELKKCPATRAHSPLSYVQNTLFLAYMQNFHVLRNKRCNSPAKERQDHLSDGFLLSLPSA